MADGDTSFWDETPEVEPAEEAVVVATFGPNAGAFYAGKNIEYKSGKFAIVDVGPVTTEQVLGFDSAGQLTWVSTEMRERAHSLADNTGAEAGVAGQQGAVVARFGNRSEFLPGRNLLYKDGMLLVDGWGGITVEHAGRLDAEGQVSWFSTEVRDWVRQSSAGAARTGRAAAMQVVGSLNGHSLGFDQDTRRFAVDESALAIERVLAYDRAGKIEWASDEMRDWAERERSREQWLLGQQQKPSEAKESVTTTGAVVAIVVLALVVLVLVGVFATTGGHSGNGPTVGQAIPPNSVLVEGKTYPIFDITNVSGSDIRRGDRVDVTPVSGSDGSIIGYNVTGIESVGGGQ